MAVASFRGVKYGALWYRSMENDKIQALKKNTGNYDAEVFLSEEAILDMTWWRDNIARAENKIDESHGEPELVIYTDASLTGWDCSSVVGRAGGHWSEREKTLHIYVLELTAAWFALKALASEIEGRHIRLMMDNTTAVACVSNMGTNHSIECNTVVRNIWSFCVERDIWVSAAYIPGVKNVEADVESRRLNMDAEWKLNSDLLGCALAYLKFTPEIDLFATRLNCQYHRFIAYSPDPEAEGVNAFNFSWSDMRWYAFPPFCLLPRVLQKISRDKGQGVLVVPYWPSQPWFPRLGSMLTEKPVLLSARENLLLMPTDPLMQHRLRKTLKILICKVSGRDSDSEDFRAKLQQWSVLPGERELSDCTQSTSKSGRLMLVKETLIPFIRL